NSSRDEEDLQGNHKAIEKYSKEVEMMVMIKVKENIIGECSKPPKNTDQRAFIGGVWTGNGEDDVEKTKDEACLVAQAR
ncbi:hypothetical protein Tco_0112543, partial [Tanacetum coccineum]